MTIKKPIIKYVESYLKQFKIKDSVLLVSVSAGIDSMVLFNLLLILSKQFNLTLNVIHFNHGLREESAEEELFVLKTMKALNIPCYCVKLDVTKRMQKTNESLEMAAHYLRYESYNYYLKKTDSDYIATAHNKDDSIETIFMKLGKSSSRESIQGLSQFNPPFIKPFYHVSKNEIIHFQNLQQIAFREDRSNYDTTIERNFWRQIIIPEIRRYFGEGYETGLMNTVSNLNWTSNDYRLLENETRQFEVKGNSALIDVSKLSSYFSEFQKKLIEKVIFKLTGQSFLLNQNQFSTLQSLLSSTTGKKIIISKTIEIVKEFEKISIRTILERPELMKEIKPDSAIFVDNKVIITKFEKTFLQNPLSEIEYIDFDKVMPPMHIRYTNSGDSFHPLGLNGVQKINRYLKSIKIPQRQREKELVVFDEIGIIWLVGHRIDERVKITDKTERIIKLEVADGA